MGVGQTTPSRVPAWCAALLAALLVAALGRPDVAAQSYSSSTVVESLPDAAQTDTFDSDDIERSGAYRLDEVLSDVEGIQLVRGSGLGVSATIDGLPASQVVVLIDGRPATRALNSRFGPAVDLASLPVSPADIERIEVSRGTGPAGSGDAGGVVINIITDRSVQTWEVDAAVSGAVVADNPLAEHGARLTVEAPISERTYAIVAGHLEHEDAVDATRDGVPDRPEHDLGAARALLGWNRARGESLALSGTFARTVTRRDALTEDREAELRDISTAALNGFFDDETSLDVGTLRLAGEWRVGAGDKVEHSTDVSLQFLRFDKVRVADTERQPNYRTDDVGVSQLVAARFARGAHTLRPELIVRGGVTTREDPGDAESDGTFTADYQAAGVGLTETWRFAPETRLDARVFAEQHSTFGFGGVASVGVNARPFEAFGWRVSFAATRRTPTPEELYFRFDHSEVGYIVEGNDALLPERLLAARGGVSTGVGVWSLSLDGFYQHLDSAIVASPIEGGATATFQYDNVDRVRSAGADVSSSLDDLPGGLSLRAGYAWLPYSRVDETDGRLPFTATHDVRATLSGRWVDDQLESWVRVSHRSHLATPEGLPDAAPQTTLDLGAAWTFGESGLRAQLDLRNLTSTVDPLWGPFTGRAGFLSLAYHFSAS